MTGSTTSFSAAEQGLGYIFQPRFALLKMLEMPESTSVLIEKNDDLDFIAEGGTRSLASLKHKAPGDTLTDLSTDFWKSVRIWLKYYIDNGRIASDAQFLLFTTAAISPASFLAMFADRASDPAQRASAANAALDRSASQTIAVIRAELGQLDEREQADFYGRITVLDETVRISDIPAQIDRHLRTVRREVRESLFQRLEGWWSDQVIRVLAGDRLTPIYGYEVSDKLSAFAEEYRSDNLPITFRNRLPDGEIDVANDPRIFVEQLRALEITPTRIQNAIIDYYRAFEQRSSWARENLLVPDEMEDYESRLIDEWVRYREITFEALHDGSEDEVLLLAGRELYRWAEMGALGIRIRERVTEPYVVRGAFHMLANERPSPRVYWHPRFMARLGVILGVAA
jgi:hypothetical protein